MTRRQGASNSRVHFGAVSRTTCGNSSAVEHRLAKAGVEGSNPFSRSKMDQEAPVTPGLFVFRGSVDRRPFHHAGGPDERLMKWAAPDGTVTLRFSRNEQQRPTPLESFLLRPPDLSSSGLIRTPGKRGRAAALDRGEHQHLSSGVLTVLPVSRFVHLLLCTSRTSAARPEFAQRMRARPQRRSTYSYRIDRASEDPASAATLNDSTNSSRDGSPSSLTT